MRRGGTTAAFLAGRAVLSGGRRLDDLYRESPERQLSNPNNSNYTLGLESTLNLS